MKSAIAAHLPDESQQETALHRLGLGLAVVGRGASR